MVFMHSGKKEEGMVVLPVYFEVRRKNGSCIAQAMVLSEDTAGLDMHGCECSEVSMEN